MSGDRTVLAELASRVAPISLAETTDQAALQTRIDKKYLLPISLLGHVLDDLGAGLRALEIDGLRVFGYESVYFDTPRLQFYRDHVQGRRLRHKVRTRRYVDSDLTMLEVKEKGGRGETVKHRTDWSPTLVVMQRPERSGRPRHPCKLVARHGCLDSTPLLAQGL